MIRGRERIRVRDSTLSFFAYSQKIDAPKTSLYFFFIRKDNTVIFIEGG